MKFGGTSVGSASRMKQVVELVNDSSRKIVVLSAVSGTTNALEQIAFAYKAQQSELAQSLISTLFGKYETFIDELYETSEAKQKAMDYVKLRFDELRTSAILSPQHSFRMEKIILAQGELMSTHLVTFFMEEMGVEANLLPALDFMRIKDGEPDHDFIEEKLTAQLASFPDCNLFITQGYICRNESGKVDNLRRGGSDYSASLIGAAIRADEIQIWTDIDGMHNNDPRVVKDTFPVHELSFDEAAELAYFGAKILHPSSILPAQKRNVPVRLLNTMQPGAKGTIINSEITGTKIKAIAAKDGITVIKIKSSRMLMAYGFLREVFQVFEEFKTPIDMITTSEVAVSVTIDHTYYLETILKKLRGFATVEVESNQTIIAIVGHFSDEDKGIAVHVFEALKDIPIRMISSGGSKFNVSMVVKEEYKEQALNALNEGLFVGKLAVV